MDNWYAVVWELVASIKPPAYSTTEKQLPHCLIIVPKLALKTRNITIKFKRYQSKSIEERIRKPWVKNEESLLEYLKHIKKFVITIN
jgi:hypothetical protein